MGIFFPTLLGILFLFFGIRIICTKRVLYSGSTTIHKVFWPLLILFFNIEAILFIDQPPNVQGRVLEDKEKRLFGGIIALVGIVMVVAAQLVLSF